LLFCVVHNHFEKTNPHDRVPRARKTDEAVGAGRRRRLLNLRKKPFFWIVAEGS
jgi:hypothetical protein